jgi:hypothetical protein
LKLEEINADGKGADLIFLWQNDKIAVAPGGRNLGFFDDVFGGIGDFVGGAIDAVSNVAEDVVGGVADTVGGVADGIGGFLGFP